MSNGALTALLDALEGHFAEPEQAPEEAPREIATTPEPRKPMRRGSYTAGRSNLRPPHPQVEDDIDQIVRDLAAIGRGNDVRQELA